MNKKTLSEADIRTKFITPAIVGPNGDKWNVMTQVREEVYFTKGRVIVRGKTVKRGEAKKADYILYYKPNIPHRRHRGKDNNHSVGAGMQQALDYAEMLDVPFVYSSNGDGFLEHDRTGTAAPSSARFRSTSSPRPTSSGRATAHAKGYTATQEAVVTQDYYDDGSRQGAALLPAIAINRTVEAIATRRESHPAGDGDRHRQDLHRVPDHLAALEGRRQEAHPVPGRPQHPRRPDQDQRLQAVRRGDDQDHQPHGRQGLRDLPLRSIRPSPAPRKSRTSTNSSRPTSSTSSSSTSATAAAPPTTPPGAKILDYFSSATQIGLTATPKETKDVSNIDYFGDPIYTYSLKQGIDDGFLAPYKVVRIDIDKDLDGWRPEKGKIDKHGQRHRGPRLQRSATSTATSSSKSAPSWSPRRSPSSSRPPTASPRRSSSARTSTTPSGCGRRWSTPTPTSPPPTASTSCASPATTTRARPQLDNFIDPESTLSRSSPPRRKLMTTGVDAQTCKLIVLDQTHQVDDRVQADHRPRHAHQRGLRQVLLHDHGFQAGHRAVRRPRLRWRPGADLRARGRTSPPVPPDDADGAGRRRSHRMASTAGDPIRRRRALRRRPTHASTTSTTSKSRVATERVQYLDADGKLITESLKDYTRKTVRKAYASLDDFLTAWNDADRKQAIIEELAEQGRVPRRTGRAGRPRLRRLRSRLPRRLRPAAAHPRERAENVRKRNVFAKYGDKARAVLDALLDKYADDGIDERRDRSRSSRSTHSPASAPRSKSSSSSAASTDYLAAVRELEAAALPEKLPELMSNVSNTRQDHPGHHAQGRRHRRRRPAPRAARLDVLPEDLRRPREGAGARSDDDYKSPLPKHLRWSQLGHRRRRHHRRRPARLRQQHALPEAQRRCTGGGDKIAGSDPHGVRGCQQLHEERHVDAAGHQQDQRHRLQRLRRPPHVRRHLREAPQGPAVRRQRRRVLHPARRHPVHRRAGQPAARRDDARPRLRHRRLPRLHHRAPAQAGQDRGRRAHHSGLLRRHREEAPAAHAVHDQPAAARHRCARPTSATTTRWPARCATGARRSAWTSSSPTRPSAAWRRTASRPTSPPSSAPAKPPTCSSCCS